MTIAMFIMVNNGDVGGFSALFARAGEVSAAAGGGHRWPGVGGITGGKT